MEKKPPETLPYPPPSSAPSSGVPSRPMSTSDSGAVPSAIASSTHVATRRQASGAYPTPSRTPAEPIKPTIAEALRETEEAVQEAVRELTGKTVIGAPQVAVIQPTP